MAPRRGVDVVDERARAAVVFHEAVVDEQRVEPVDRLRREGDAEGVRVREIDAAARDDVVDVAIVLVPHAGEAQLHAVAQLDVPHGLERRRAVVAERQGRHALVRLRRLCRADHDGAARRVAAEERALRALEDFHAIEVEHRRVDALRTRVDQVAHVRRDRRVGQDGEFLLAQATDREQRRRAARTVARGDRQAGHLGAECHHVGDALRREFCAPDGADGDRHRLDRLFATARRHDDFLEAADDRAGLRRLLFLRVRLGGRQDGQAGEHEFYCSSRFPPFARKMSRFDRPAARALRDLLYAVKLVQHKYPHIIRILERIGPRRRTAGGGDVRP